MSGHSKWHNIKHRKAGVDAKRGKIFTRHAKLVQIAASEGGGDPGMNASLRAAIENARADNVPMDNIDRAIKKGTGESKDNAQIEEVFYEGFAPGGTVLYIEALTDNRNRTISSLNTIMGKKGGKLGSAGSVGYLFLRRGMIEVPFEGKDTDEIELAAIDAGAEDVVKSDSEEPIIEVYTDPQELMKVKTTLEEGGISVKSAKITFLPQNDVSVNDQETAQKIMDLIDALEDDEDISTVYTNADISDDVLEKLS